MVTKTNGLRAQSVRRRNLALVFETVRQAPATRSELVLSTGLTRTSIGGLVGELVSLGLLREEAGRSDGRPGRPSPVVCLDDGHVAALAVDVGVDSLAVGVVGVDGVMIRSTRMPVVDGALGPERVCAHVAELAEGLGCRDGESSGRRLVGVGVAIPALVRQPGNVVAFAPNLDWSDVSFGEMLTLELAARRVAAAPVVVANEADAAGVAEARFGAAATRSNVLCVYGDVGVGGAVVANGSRLVGHNGFSGEVGHIPVNPEGRPCHCGGSGCWETEIGAWALRRRAGLALDSESDTVDDVLGLLERNEHRAASAVRDHGRWVGIGLAGLINVLDPEVIVLGGLLGRLLPAFGDAMREELDGRRLRGIERSTEVLASQLGVDAPLVGAAQVAFGALVDDPFGVVRSHGVHTRG